VVRAHLGRTEATGLLAARVAAMPGQARQLVEAMACLGGRAEPSLLQPATARATEVMDQMLVAEQYLPVSDAVDDVAERRQVVRLLRRAANQAALVGDNALVNAMLAAALRLIRPG
jgi:hypothetical protein